MHRVRTGGRQRPDPSGSRRLREGFGIGSLSENRSGCSLENGLEEGKSADGKAEQVVTVQEEMGAVDTERKGRTRDETWRQNQPHKGMEGVRHLVGQRASGDSWVPRGGSIKISPMKLLRERCP